MIKTKIIHLSDLHFGNNEANLLASLESSIADQKPNLIIISGDIVDSPCQQYFTTAEEFLSRLKKLVNEDNLIIVLGNHDVRWRGVIPWPFRLPERFKSRKHEHFNFCYKENLSLFLFNSNITIDRDNLLDSLKSLDFKLAAGRISFSAIKTFRETTDRLKKGNYSFEGRNISEHEYNRSFKIAVLHHHPLPIPYSGTEIYSLTNAGVFLNELLEKGIDLVLHGHKHYKNLSYWMPYGKSKLCVSSTGSALQSTDKEPFSYNVITIYKDNIVEITSYETRHAQRNFQPTSPIPCVSIADFKANLFNKNTLTKGYNLKRLTKEVSLSSLGDAVITCYIEGLKVEKELESLPLGASVGTGQLSRNFKLVKRSLMALELESTSEKCTYKKLAKNAKFGQKLTKYSNGVSFAYTYKTLGAHAMDMDEANLLYDERRDWESTCHTVEKPCENLELRIMLPAKLNLTEDDITLYIYEGDRTELRLERWEHEEKRNLSFRRCKEKDTFCISLNVQYPPLGYTYEVRWRIPKKEEKTDGVSKFSDLLNEKLLSLCKKHISELVEIQSHLKTFRSACFQEFLGSELSEKDIDINLMVLDKEKKCFKIAACLSPVDDPLWKLEFPAGIGVAWWAYKNTVITVCIPKRMDELSDFYIRPEELGIQGIQNHEVLISSPLYLETKDDIFYKIDGVLNFGSRRKEVALKVRFLETLVTGKISSESGSLLQKIIETLNLNDSINKVLSKLKGGVEA